MVVRDTIVCCPQCHGLSRHGSLLAYNHHQTAWTDGWVSPSLEPPPIVRCNHCKLVGWRENYQKLGWLVEPEIHCRLDIVEPGENRLAVMKLVRGVSGKSLAETKRFITELPATLLSDSMPEEAIDLERRLNELGATTSLTHWQVGESSPARWLAALELKHIDEPAEILHFLDHSPELPVAAETAIRAYLFQLWNHPYRNSATPWIPVQKRGPEQLGNARRLLEILDGESADELFMKAEIAREMEEYATASNILSGKVLPESEGARQEYLEIVATRSSSVRVLAVCA
jgi:hypothetical protein